MVVDAYKKIKFKQKFEGGKDIKQREIWEKAERAGDLKALRLEYVCYTLGSSMWPLTLD